MLGEKKVQPKDSLRKKPESLALLYYNTHQ